MVFSFADTFSDSPNWSQYLPWRLTLQHLDMRLLPPLCKPTEQWTSSHLTSCIYCIIFLYIFTPSTSSSFSNLLYIQHLIKYSSYSIQHLFILCCRSWLLAKVSWGAWSGVWSSKVLWYIRATQFLIPYILDAKWYAYCIFNLLSAILLSLNLNLMPVILVISAMWSQPISPTRAEVGACLFTAKNL